MAALLSSYTDVNAWKRDYFSSSLKGKTAAKHKKIPSHARKDPRMERRSIATDFINSVGHFFGTFFKSTPSGRVQQLAGVRSQVSTHQAEGSSGGRVVNDGTSASLGDVSVLGDDFWRIPGGSSALKPALGTAQNQKSEETLPTQASRAAAPEKLSQRDAEGPDEAAAAIVDSLFLPSSEKAWGRGAGQARNEAGGAAGWMEAWREDGSKPLGEERAQRDSGEQQVAAKAWLRPLILIPAGATGAAGSDWRSSPGDNV